LIKKRRSCEGNWECGKIYDGRLDQGERAPGGIVAVRKWGGREEISEEESGGE